MKILKAYFKNFQGFYTGMNLTELALDFTKSIDSAFNVIFGRNASGKSTLLSCLQPFPGTNDNRVDIIRAGHEGYKEIIFKSKDDYFQSIIIYPKEIKGKRPVEKCYLYKLKKGVDFNTCTGEDWDNLNPNGGKLTYITALEDHLHITKDFFMVGRLGGVDNFIDLNKSDRKKFIANFLPDVDPYLAANDTVSKKVTTYKKMMVAFGEELNKLIPLDECQLNLSSINDSLNIENQKLEKLNQEYGSAKNVVDTILNETSEKIPELREFARTGKNPLDKEAEILKESIEKLKKNIDGFENKDFVEKEIESISNSLIDLTAKKAKEETNQNNALQNKESYNFEINKLASRIDAIKAKVGVLEKLKDNLKEKEAEVEKYQAEREEFKKPIFKHFVNMTPEVMITFKSIVTELRIILNSVRASYDEAGLKSLSLTDSVAINKLMFDMKVAYKKANATIERIAESKARLPLLEANARQEAILLKRPAECKNNTCPFIAAAVEFEGATLEYKRVLRVIETSEEEEAKAKEIIDEYEPKIKFLSTFENFYKEKIFNAFKDKPLLKLYPKIQDITTSFDRYIEILSMSGIEFDDLMDISHIERYVNHKTNLVKSREEVDELKEKIANVEESSGYITQLNEDYDNLKKNLDEAEEILNNANSVIEGISSEIEYKKSEITKLKCINQSFDLLKDKETEMVLLDSKIESMVKYLADVHDSREIMLSCNKEIAAVKSEINRLTADKDKYNHQIETRKDLEAKLSKMQDEYKTLEIVKRCTDTVKGIPLYLIDAYLEDIRQRTNTLLQVAYNGDFVLDRFVINEKEFAIPVIRSNGDKLDDITLGSGAETSLVKSSLSFAIIQKAMGDYNILSLDEIDGCLDESKRKEFIRMLRKQVEELGIEQMFIISHNRVFLDEPLNLILLKDHGIETNNEELMENKSVIFNYYH